MGLDVARCGIDHCGHRWNIFIILIGLARVWVHNGLSSPPPSMYAVIICCFHSLLIVHLTDECLSSFILWKSFGGEEIGRCIFNGI